METYHRFIACNKSPAKIIAAPKYVNRIVTCLCLSNTSASNPMKYTGRKKSTDRDINRGNIKRVCKMACRSKDNEYCPTLVFSAQLPLILMTLARIQANGVYLFMRKALTLLVACLSVSILIIPTIITDNVKPANSSQTAIVISIGFNFNSKQLRNKGAPMIEANCLLVKY